MVRRDIARQLLADADGGETNVITPGPSDWESSATSTKPLCNADKS